MILRVLREMIRVAAIGWQVVALAWPALTAMVALWWSRRHRDQ